MQRRILLAEDSEQTHRQLRPILEGDENIKVDTVADAPAALKALGEQSYSVFLADLSMDGCAGLQLDGLQLAGLQLDGLQLAGLQLDGLKLMEEIQKQNIPTTVIVMAGHGSIDQAVQAMRLGAYDFLSKPVDKQHLRLVVERVLRERRLQDEVAYLREQLQQRFSFHNIISKNPRMHAVFELISNVAQTGSTVLIEGETGTGKEQVAQAIHQSSQVRSGPMVAVNCAAIPETLLESELFGHEKGSFTGAIGQRRGRFELANGGTIFLDEVGDIPPPMQAKLLRVLQERRFERVGGALGIEVDVRVVAATNRNLLKLVEENRFREDLYYRLNVVKIELPPLRDRKEDIPLLAACFAEKNARPGDSPKQLAPKAMNALLQYHWPGNIRELENAIERGCVTSMNGSILPENLPQEIFNGKPAKAPFPIDLNQPLPVLLRQVDSEIEHEYIRKALEQSGGVVSLCAKICGLSRRTLSSKLSEYQIDKSLFRGY
ncbi:MAG: sigma-54-dependent Fis family transcriptional regulator [Planctomycetes bacterium]|nr:sigma-54-dependent Fis family transcriptional regulator [Planctomycetota bacterium]